MVDDASEAFEQSEKLSKAHQNIEITDAHEKLATRPRRKVSTGEDQAGQKKKGRRRPRISSWLEEVLRNSKAE